MFSNSAEFPILRPIKSAASAFEIPSLLATWSIVMSSVMTAGSTPFADAISCKLSKTIFPVEAGPCGET